MMVMIIIKDHTYLFLNQQRAVVPLSFSNCRQNFLASVVYWQPLNSVRPCKSVCVTEIPLTVMLVNVTDNNK
jgi:hypothetical protein